MPDLLSEVSPELGFSTSAATWINRRWHLNQLRSPELEGVSSQQISAGQLQTTE